MDIDGLELNLSDMNWCRDKILNQEALLASQAGQIEYLNLKLQEAKAFVEKVADDGGNRMQYYAVVALSELEQPK